MLTQTTLTPEEKLAFASLVLADQALQQCREHVLALELATLRLDNELARQELGQVR